MFSVSATPISRDSFVRELNDSRAGALVTFEGWVRDHNQGKKVKSLEYQVYHELALKEGEKILKEAREKFNLHNAVCVHREGHLQLNEIAVMIGATASHRDDAFKASRYIIDEIKHRLPVWKKEHYVGEAPEWVFCRHHHHHVHFTEAEYYQKQNSVIEQSKLKNAKVAVIGAGGLGCPALTNLAMAGVGAITIFDFDHIQISNIHRQPLFSPNLAGEKKAVVAKTKLLELNPFISVSSVVERVDYGNALQLLAGFDLVLDCTDSMRTKFLLHDACFKLRTPLVSASVYRSEGQLRTFVPGAEHGCLRCFLGHTPDDSLLGNCNDFGVTGTVTGVLGALQASEALQFLQTGTNASATQTFYYNLKNLSQFGVKNKKAENCAVCAGDVMLETDDLEVTSIEDGELLDIRAMSDEEVLKISPSAKKIILSCHRGVRSRRMAQSLRGIGHTNVFSLKGGACSL